MAATDLPEDPEARSGCVGVLGFFMSSYFYKGLEV